MSTPEHEAGGFEAKSSVKISRTAKGEPTFEVKAYAGATEHELEQLERIAVARFESLTERFYGGAS